MMVRKLFRNEILSSGRGDAVSTGFREIELLATAFKLPFRHGGNRHGGGGVAGVLDRRTKTPDFFKRRKSATTKEDRPQQNAALAATPEPLNRRTADRNGKTPASLGQRNERFVGKLDIFFHGRHGIRLLGKWGYYGCGFDNASILMGKINFCQTQNELC